MGGKRSSLIGCTTALLLFVLPSIVSAATARVTIPSLYQVVSGTSFQLRAGTSNSGTVVFLIDGLAKQIPSTSSEWRNPEWRYYATLDTTTLTNGRHTVQVKLTIAGVNTYSTADAFYVVNDTPSLPSGCTTTSTSITCTSDFGMSARSGLMGYGNWIFFTRMGTIGLRSPLTWQPGPRTWIDTLGSQTRVRDTGVVYSDPAALLRLLWLSPPSLPMGTATVTLTARDGNTASGTSASVTVYPARNPAALQTLTIPNGSLTLPAWTRTFSFTNQDTLYVDVDGGAPTNILGNAVQIASLSVRYTGVNQAPRLTKLPPSFPEAPRTIDVSTLPYQTMFDFTVSDEDASRLTYECIVNGTSYVGADCAPTRVAPGVWRYSRTWGGGDYLVVLQARDLGGRISVPIGWSIKIAAPCGNGRIDPGEVCDIALSPRSCNNDCRASRIDPNISMDCIRYRNLPAASLSQPLPDPWNTWHRVYDLVDIGAGGEGKRFVWREDDPAPVPYGERYGVRCKARFTVGTANQYVFAIGGSGGVRASISGYGTIRSAWAAYAGGTKVKGTMEPKYTLNAGLQEIVIDMQHYQNSQQPWIYAAWLPAPQGSWAGFQIPAVPAGTLPVPVILSIPGGQTDQLRGALNAPWAGTQPEFDAALVGNFAFGQVGRYGFNGTVDDDLKLYYMAGQGRSDKLFTFRGTSSGNTYQWDLPEAGTRTLYADYHNEDGTATTQISWLKMTAPSTAVCGNGRLDTGEQCDHGGTPGPRCDQFCTIPPTTPAPVCGDRIVQEPEACDPPASGTCSSSCQRITPPTGRCGDLVCNTSETAASCPGDCGSSSTSATQVNNNVKYTDITIGTPRIVDRIFVPEGPALGCGNGIVVSKLESSQDPDSATAGSQTISIDGSGANGAMGDQAWCGVGAGVHNVASTIPTNGFSVSHSVCVGCRSHPPGSYIPGSMARVYVPPNGYASVRFLYGRPGTSYGRSLGGMNVSVPSGGSFVLGTPTNSTTSALLSLTAKLTNANLKVNRPIIIRQPPRSSGTGGTGSLVQTAGQAAGSGIALGRWVRQPRWAFVTGNGGNYPVTIRRVELYVKYPYANAVAFNWPFHLPACVWGGPYCSNAQKQILDFGNMDDVPVEQIYGILADKLHMSEDDPERAEIIFKKSVLVEGTLGGQFVQLVDPPDSLRDRVTGISTTNRASALTFVDTHEEGGESTLRKAIVATDPTAYPYRGTTVLFHRGGNYDPPDMIEVNGIEFRCDPISEPRVRSTCARIMDVVQDNVTNGDGFAGLSGGFNGAIPVIDHWRWALGIDSRSTNALSGRHTLDEHYAGIRIYTNEQDVLKSINQWWIDQAE